MTDTLQTLGWALIHFCWQATVILALYLTLDLTLRNTRSHTRYLVALATLSSMFLVFAVTLGYEAWHSSVTSPRPFVAVPVNTFTSRMELLTNYSKPFHWTALLPWLDGVWMLGVAGLSIRSFGGWLWLQRLRQTATEEASETLRASFQKICAKVGITRLPKLRISPIIAGPLTVGILRTLVLLPASALLALSPEQLEAVFAHELAHIRRADYFWNLIQTLAETLFFFHPAVWWLGKRLRDQRELCCDDIAVEVCSDPLIYATALFQLENQRAAGLNLAMALDGHQSQTTFRARILRILGETAAPSRASQFRPLSLAAVAISLFLLFSPLPKALGSAAAQSRPVKAVLELPAEIAHATKRLSPQSTLSAPVLQKEPDKTPVSTKAAQRTDPALNILSYEEQMRRVGYDVEPAKYTVMQNAGVTPEYAKDMGNLGLGRPTVGTLLVLEDQHVSVDEVLELRAAGIEPRNFDQLISFRIFHVTPDFIKGMKDAGFDSLPPHTLISLRAAGVTPEYAKTMKQQRPNASVHDLIESRASQSAGNHPDFPRNILDTLPPASPDAATPPPPPGPGPKRQSMQNNSPPPLIQ
jgi:beta-lactamase regulating signal transducer with metallopeptidase domain